MSDAPAAAEGGKKKGGKLPIIIVLALVLGGGGFFAMKSKSSKGPPKPPPLELGAMMPLGDEFIINLHEREYFVRTKVTVQIEKNAHIGGGGGHGGGTPDELNAMRDAVVARMNSISIEDIGKPNFYSKLKHLLAEDINHQLHILHASAEEESKEKDSKEEKGSKGKKGKEEEPAEPAHTFEGPKPGDLEHVDLSEAEKPEWDSDEGPVLKVFFTDFATMRE